MIKSLFWKEWRQQRWKLAYGCVLLMGSTLVGLRSRLMPDQIIVGLSVIGGSFLMPLLVGMGLVAEERQEGCLDMLLALPVPSWKIFAVKMLVGAAVCVGPILGSMIGALVTAAGREQSASAIVIPYLGGAAFGLAVLVWAVAFGVRQPSEARAGLVAIGVLVVWAFAAFAFEVFLGHHFNRASLEITPYGFFEATLDGDYEMLPRLIALQLLMAACLLFWAGYRFGRLGRSRV
ncbi:MAG: ABC transporter permease [Phycisphaerales bacterium]|nr:MAG: ABC transporter permease [Phycisphaerales bacterium]